MTFDEFMKHVREYNERQRHPRPYVEDLLIRITTPQKSNEKYLELEKEVERFFESDASEGDKTNVLGHVEPLVMICNAIREGRL